MEFQYILYQSELALKYFSIKIKTGPLIETLFIVNFRAIIHMRIQKPILICNELYVLARRSTQPKNRLRTLRYHLWVSAYKHSVCFERL